MQFTPTSRRPVRKKSKKRMLYHRLHMGVVLCFAACCRDPGNDVAQVQHGAINCLAVLLQTSAQGTLSTAADMSVKAMRVGVRDVPHLIVSVAVEGVLPETTFGGGNEDEAHGWLRGALKEAFRREGDGAADGGSGKLLPAQVSAWAFVEHAALSVGGVKPYSLDSSSTATPPPVNNAAAETPAVWNNVRVLSRSTRLRSLLAR